MQQGGQVFQTMSVWENIELAADGNSLEAIRDIIPLLQRPKRELQRQMADKLSGGQKHQLALAMALATQPRLVILDEPSAGLSPKSVEEMYTLLTAVREQMKVTIVLIEQNVAKAVGYCDRSVMIEQGCINAKAGVITNLLTAEHFMFAK
jgi:ABC-type branched-subunit amino acid transport system ATPase component